MKSTSEKKLLQEAISHLHAYQNIREYFQKLAEGGNKEAKNILNVINNPSLFFHIDSIPTFSNVGLLVFDGVPASPNNQPLLAIDYNAPKISLQQLLKQPWFEKSRKVNTYTEEWTDSFVSALMESQWKETIAKDWTIQGKRNKRNQIMGYVIGLLSDYGVLKGSYNKIAKKIELIKNTRTFSRYMSDGKYQPYADWVKNYIEDHTKV